MKRQIKLKWSQDSLGNWNGKRGPYALMVVAYHVRPGFRHDGNLTRTADGDWHLHPKLPGLKSVPVQTAQAGMQVGQELFDDWLIGVWGSLR